MKLEKLAVTTKMTACELFTVDRGLVTSFLATTFTYWVVLIQSTNF